MISLSAIRPAAYLTPRMSNSEFKHKQRVRYSDVTVGNHVFYSRYLEFIEDARSEYFRDIGLPLIDLTEKNIQLPVVELQVEYREPARYDDDLTVSVRLTHLTRLRMTIQYQILNQASKVLVEASIHHACVSNTGRPCRMPPHLHARLRDRSSSSRE